MTEVFPACLRDGLGMIPPASMRGYVVHGLIVGLGVANSIILVVLALLAIRRWRARRDRAAGWLALAFLAITAIATVGRLVPKDPDGAVGYLAQRLDIELLVLFPYLLYRFGTEFVRPGRRLQLAVGSLTLGLTIFTFALPTI